MFGFTKCSISAMLVSRGEVAAMAWMYAWGKGRGDLGWRARDAPELAHAEETTPRSNFVTEAETNLVMRGGIHVVVSRRP